MNTSSSFSTINQYSDTVNEVDILTIIEQFKYGLISRATGGDYDNSEYVRIRKLLMQDIKIRNVIPQFIKSCRNINEFWQFIKEKFSKYAERRDYLTNELKQLAEAVELIELDERNNGNIDAYEIGDRIGFGGYGEVFKYRHKLLDYDFAIKVLNPSFVPTEDIEEYNKRFFREAKILFELDHPNIVRVYDTGIIDKKPFIRMEYVNGYNMNELLIKFSRISFEKSKKPICALLEGLSYAHNKGIIHRDLKPTNFMVTHNGLFKIIDFGISAYIENDLHTKLTRTGEQIAAGLYTDPELMRNPKLRDVRSDIYSVGAIWYYLLTGRAPSGSDMRDVLIKSTDITSLQADMVMKCLSQDINNRYNSCEELLQKLIPPQISIDGSSNVSTEQRITDVTKEDLIDYLREFYQYQEYQYIQNVPQGYEDYNKVFIYNGRKTQVEFLGSLYNISEMPSNDKRFSNFENELIAHTVNNDDYSIYWVFDDERLGLRRGNDETLLKFISHMFHPLFRKEKSEWQSILGRINELLKEDGYEIIESGRISNRSVYSYRSIL